MLSFNESISSYFPREIAACASERGLDADVLFNEIGVRPEVVNSASGRVTPKQFADLIRNIIFLAKDEFFCLGYKPVSLGHFKMMSKLSLLENTLGDVYKTMAKFYALTIDWLHVELSHSSDSLKVRFILLKSVVQKREQLLMEILMILWHRFPSWVVDKGLPLKYAQTSYANPVYKDEYRLMYPCPVRSARDHCGFDLPVSNLQLPVKKHMNDLHGYLQNALLDWFTKQQYSPKYTKEILTLMQNSEDIGGISIESVAKHFHMCHRNLRRKLNEENTNFSTIKDNFRRDLAIKLLGTGSYPLQQISSEVGYSEVSAFSRAFRSWTGVSPKRYRR